MTPRKESLRQNEDVILCLAWKIVGGNGTMKKYQLVEGLMVRVKVEYEENKPTMWFGFSASLLNYLAS